MLTSEDRKVLGMIPETTKVRRPSAVSQILRAISDDLEHAAAEWDISDEEDALPGFHMLVAADRRTRQRAYALAHRVYHGRGYVSNNQNLIVAHYDTCPQ